MLLFGKGKKYLFSPIFRPLSEATIRGEYKYVDDDGRRYAIPRGRKFRQGIVKRVYLDDHPGVAICALWSERGLTLQGRDNERPGYPTQKPLALLERIINASCPPDGWVLDPFAGCATACVAAERLGRSWVGIDLSPKTIELVEYRLKHQERDIALWTSQVVARTDIPRRTNIDAPKNYRKDKHILFGQQEGKCAGCRMDFPFKIFEIDHKIPKSKGGTNHMDNLQLLCGHCNKIKGAEPMEHLTAQLHDRNMIAVK